MSQIEVGDLYVAWKQSESLYCICTKIIGKMMRKLLAIALFSYTCFPILAQHITYFNYLNYTSKWQYQQDYIGIGGVHGFNEFIYFIDGDTLIEGNWYYKIRQISRQTQESPDFWVGSVHNYYVYALMETPDSLFVYRYPDGAVENILQSHAGWSGKNIVNVEGQIPHRVYWWGHYPIQGWIEGIGLGQEGGQFPFEPGSKYFVCYSRDSLSTVLLGGTCVIEDLLTITEVPIDQLYSSLSPNPANDFVTIQGVDHTKGTVTLLIYAPDGRQVLAYEGTGEGPIDIHTLNDGIYFVSIRLDKRSFTSKLIVNR